MTVIWSVVINCAVFVAMYRFNKFSFWIHAIIGWIVIGLTLAGILIFVTQIGFQIEPLDEVPLVDNVHNVAGFIILFWVVLQASLGIAARQIQ
jgi:hypothetical protein